jgi:hypothetical protein
MREVWQPAPDSLLVACGQQQRRFPVAPPVVRAGKNLGGESGPTTVKQRPVDGLAQRGRGVCERWRYRLVAYRQEPYGPQPCPPQLQVGAGQCSLDEVEVACGHRHVQGDAAFVVSTGFEFAENVVELSVSVELPGAQGKRAHPLGTWQLLGGVEKIGDYIGNRPASRPGGHQRPGRRPPFLSITNPMMGYPRPSPQTPGHVRRPMDGTPTSHQSSNALGKTPNWWSGHAKLAVGGADRLAQRAARA